MDIFRIISIGLITLCLGLIVRQIKPEISIFVSLAGGIIIFLLLINMLGALFSEIGNITQKAGIDDGLFAVLMKIVGIGYLTEFASDVCADADNSSLANKIQLGGKITILFLALPIFSSIFQIIAGLVS